MASQISQIQSQNPMHGIPPVSWPWHISDFTSSHHPSLLCFWGTSSFLICSPDTSNMLQAAWIFMLAVTSFQKDSPSRTPGSFLSTLQSLLQNFCIPDIYIFFHAYVHGHPLNSLFFVFTFVSDILYSALSSFIDDGFCYYFFLIWVVFQSCSFPISELFCFVGFVFQNSILFLNFSPR